MSVQIQTDNVELEAAVLDAIAARLIEPVARRVVEVLKEEGVLPQPASPQRWLDAAEVAQLLQVNREWVYEHASELGVVRIGHGSRPRLRFPPDMTRRERTLRAARVNQDPKPRDPRSRSLIPIYDG